ncbi:DNA-binding transcriptional MocR family regulator [Azospirillum agricola]|uniref:aminotransferase-like domain-containing protein n=1 Tax=Azospirillum agricola TaxID=1720247 RepID=UPI001AE6E822|nr:PLP-dependent aminotransferase family protein [Azospirillum agricola]MBP2231868.1 DNA-binding transcriptional MocR family regulator [Azospirillum agricola]
MLPKPDHRHPQPDAADPEGNGGPEAHPGGAPWVPVLERTDGPLYLALAAAIESAIASGELPPGFRLPPQRWLANALGITAGTVNRGYAIARERGLVTGEVGRGTFIREGERSIATVPPASPLPVMAEPRLPAPEPLAVRPVDLSCFRSPVAGLDGLLAPVFAEAAARVARLPPHRYPPVAGHRPHREAAARWLRRFGLEVPADRVMVTMGAQHATFLTLKALTNPGDAVLTEAVTYSGVKTMAELLGLRLVGVPMDGEGLDPAALERLAGETRARLLVTQPSLHNPTVQRMPAERRQRVAATARAFDLTVIEDDTAAAALADRPPAIAALAPERSVFIASPAKCISPALRVGVLTAAPDLLERIEDTAHLADLAIPPFAGELLAVMVEDGTADRVVAAYRAVMGERYAIAEAALRGQSHSGHPAAFHLWLHLPESWSARDFAAAAREEGILVVPADNFTVGDATPRAVRVSVNGNATADELRRSMETLARLAGTRRRRLFTVV